MTSQGVVMQCIYPTLPLYTMRYTQVSWGLALIQHHSASLCLLLYLLIPPLSHLELTFYLHIPVECRKKY